MRTAQRPGSSGISQQWCWQTEREEQRQTVRKAGLSSAVDLASLARLRILRHSAPSGSPQPNFLTLLQSAERLGLTYIPLRTYRIAHAAIFIKPVRFVPSWPDLRFVTLWGELTEGMSDLSICNGALHIHTLLLYIWKLHVFSHFCLHCFEGLGVSTADATAKVNEVELKCIW